MTADWKVGLCMIDPIFDGLGLLHLCQVVLGVGHWVEGQIGRRCLFVRPSVP